MIGLTPWAFIKKLNFTLDVYSDVGRYSEVGVSLVIYGNSEHITEYINSK